jgi:hypothetical protein
MLQMKTLMAKTMASGAGATVLLLLHAGASQENHSLIPFFDTDTPVTITGTIVRFERVNPHSYMYVEQETADGTVTWSVEAPAPRLLAMRSEGQERLAEGDRIEACGYMLKDGTAPRQVPGRRVLVAEIVETSDGEARLWSDYGNRHCRDQNRYAIPTGQ